MTVYVDLLFGLNTLINYLLLRGSAAMGGCSAKGWRLPAAAALGGAYAVAVVLPGCGWLQKGIFQLLSGCLMVLLAFGRKRNTVKQGLFFLALSFAFGGVVLLAVQLTEPNWVLLGGRAYYGVSLPSLLLLAGLCYGLAAAVLSGWGTHTGGDLVELELEVAGRKTALKALWDTGNTLRDPITGTPVLVVGEAVFSRLLPELLPMPKDPAQLLTRAAGVDPALRFRLIAYEAVGVPGGVLPAVRCTVTQGKKRETMLVAFANGGLSGGGQFEGLMGGMII